jgi:hypothetical protein
LTRQSSPTSRGFSGGSLLRHASGSGRLELKSSAAIAAVARILELTPILEVLMLLIMLGDFEVQSMLTTEVKRRSAWPYRLARGGRRRSGRFRRMCGS